MPSKGSGLGFDDFVSSTGYEFAAEAKGYRFPDVSTGTGVLNRGTCVAGVDPSRQSEVEPDWMRDVYDDVTESMFPTTLRQSAPTIDISQPLVGHYFGTPNGTFFDAYLGVGQRLIDENHPHILEMIQRLLTFHALLRREAATNDLLGASPESRLVTPQELAALLTATANRAFPSNGPFKAYLCSSGAEAIEAAMKMACLDTYQRLVDRWGYDVEADLMREFGIARKQDLDHPEDKLPLFEDYPMFFISARGAFHGRTLGALSLTHVRPVNKRGFPTISRVRRIDFNGDVRELDELIDTRDLRETLSLPGGVTRVLAEGRIPRQLVAGFVIEAFQGEGGYRIADPEWLRRALKVCHENEITVIADEIQTFARTGKTFAFEHFGLEPDIVAISKASVVGAALASARYARSTPLGWHSTTWGGGKILDNSYAWTVLDTYLNYHDPCFNMTYIENQRNKGEYIQAAFEWLAGRHPQTLLDFRGFGGMWGFSVRRRSDVCSSAWRHGLKLLSCGVTDEVSSVRALFLADVLTKEIDCFARLLDVALSEVESRK